MYKPIIWHPFTQHGAVQPEICIDHAKDAYLFTREGQRIVDGISSWWVITHGHCHPKISAAIQDQAQKLDQIIFAGFKHEPAEALASKLIEITPSNLEHVFFSDSGSTAVEVALKMAIGYFAHKGLKRNKIIALKDGYHGDTFGAMSAGGRSIFNALYEPYLFAVEHLDVHGPLDKFETAFKQGDVAALILEPLIQGAGGMNIYPAETLKNLADLCKKYNVLLIADEVMTGFGRTGTRFACGQANVEPDLLCLSKGLTGGFLPLGVTLATREIYDAFYGADRSKMFFHSSSFTGNPLACRAALANLEIWDEEPVFEKINTIAQAHTKAITRFSARKGVENIRSIGTVFALDIKIDSPQDYLAQVGPVFYKNVIAQGALLRPLGNTVYILPPYCVSIEDLEFLYGSIERSLDALGHERG